MIEKTRPFPVENPKLPYSPVVQFGNSFFFSGTLPLIGKENKPLSRFIGEQTGEVLAKMKEALEKCGLTFNDLLKVEIMLLGTMDDYATVNEIYSEVLKDVEIMPARVCTAHAALPFGALIEIAFIAGKKEQ